MQEDERGGAGRKAGVWPEGWAPASTSVPSFVQNRGE